MLKIISNQGIKRPGSSMTGVSRKRPWKSVEIPEDAWLDVLKYLSCSKWSKMRLMSRWLSGVVERNVSRLPLGVIDSVVMKTRVTYSLMPMLRQQRENEVKMIVSGSTILPDEQDQWFKNRGMTDDLPADIQLVNAIIGVSLAEKCCADLCVLGPEQKKKLTPFDKKLPWFSGQQFKAEVLFYAEFNPHRNKYSWASIAYFLKLLYDPSTYVKKLSIYALDTKLKDILFSGEEDRYIRCGFFTPQVITGASIENICKSVSWLEQNVQADTIELPNSIPHDNQICDAMGDYLLGSSWISANQVVKLGKINDLERFFKALIKKFPTIPVQSIFPTIVISGLRSYCCKALNNQLSGKGIVKEVVKDPENNSDDSQSDDDEVWKGYYNDEIYTITNGSNRMKFIRLAPKRKPFTRCICWRVPQE